MALSNLRLSEFSDLTYNCPCKKRHVLNASIYYGSYQKTLKAVLEKACPYSKIAYISTSESFSSMGKDFYDILSALGIKSLNVLLKKQTENKIENVSGLFNLPENIRAIILTENSLLPLISYFASLKNIPVIFIPSSLSMANVFDKYVYVTINGKEVKADNSCYKYLLIDETLIKTDKENMSDAFAGIISKTLDLIDYRVKGNFVSTWTCKESFNLARTAIKNVSGIMSLPHEKRVLCLIENQFKLSIASNFTAGKLFDLNGVDGVAKILKQKSKGDASVNECRLIALLKLIDLYRLYFSDYLKGLLSVPDFNKRAESFSAITGIKELELLQSYKKYYYKDGYINDRTKSIKETLKKELDGLTTLKDKIINTYYGLGGKTYLNGAFSKEDIKDALFFGADFPGSFSALTLIRNCGALELLKTV